MTQTDLTIAQLLAYIQAKVTTTGTIPNVSYELIQKCASNSSTIANAVNLKRTTAKDK
jgi:hypothetical protein